MVTKKPTIQHDRSILMVLYNLGHQNYLMAHTHQNYLMVYTHTNTHQNYLIEHTQIIAV